uniref:Uncharacterized protein n=1 Tax=Arundo donax TaxID=35708 RepID=A0A0A8ZQ63_ARUDO
MAATVPAPRPSSNDAAPAPRLSSTAASSAPCWRGPSRSPPPSPPPPFSTIRRCLFSTDRRRSGTEFSLNLNAHDVQLRCCPSLRPLCT